MKEAKGGTLYLIPTPLGNPADMSPRCLRLVDEVDVLLAEDTRTSGDLLHALGHFRPMRSCHDHNEDARAREIVLALKEGRSVGLLSDAGTPLMSDPGLHLVQAVIAAGLDVVSVPGPFAGVTALVASGFPVQRACFVGFLPRDAKPRKDAIAELARHPGALVIYEAPHRALEALDALAEGLGPRRACLAWNLTKPRETCIRGTLPEIAAELRSWEFVHGEMTLVIEGDTSGGEDAAWRRAEAVAAALAAHDLPLSTQRDIVAAACELPRRAVYAWLLERRDSST